MQPSNNQLITTPFGMHQLGPIKNERYKLVTDWKRQKIDGALGVITKMMLRRDESILINSTFLIKASPHVNDSIFLCSS